MARPFSIRLTPADRKKLLHAYRSAESHRHRLRAQILLLLDDGFSVAEVQAATFADETEVANAVRLFREGGAATVLQGE
jgi:hypothetical protein